MSPSRKDGGDIRLAITQMVLGALVLLNWLSLSLGITWWRIPTWPEHNLLEGVWRVLTLPLFTAFLVLGLAVFGCGIAQFLIAKGLKGAKIHT